MNFCPRGNLWIWHFHKKPLVCLGSEPSGGFLTCNNNKLTTDNLRLQENPRLENSCVKEGTFRGLCSERGGNLFRAWPMRKKPDFFDFFQNLFWKSIFLKIRFWKKSQKSGFFRTYYADSYENSWPPRWEQRGISLRFFTNRNLVTVRDLTTLS